MHMLMIGMSFKYCNWQFVLLLFFLAEVFCVLLMWNLNVGAKLNLGKNRMYYMRRYEKIISVFVKLLKLVHGMIALLISLPQYLDYETLRFTETQLWRSVHIFQKSVTLHRFKIKRLSCKRLWHHYTGTRGIGNWTEDGVGEMCWTGV